MPPRRPRAAFPPSFIPPALVVAPAPAASVCGRFGVVSTVHVARTARRSRGGRRQLQAGAFIVPIGLLCCRRRARNVLGRVGPVGPSLPPPITVAVPRRRRLVVIGGIFVVGIVAVGTSVIRELVCGGVAWKRGGMFVVKAAAAAVCILAAPFRALEVSEYYII
jgi:hypothetical protein